MVGHHLARHGWSVHFLRRARREAVGFAAAGMAAPHAEGLGGPLLALAQYSLHMMPTWGDAIEAASSASKARNT